MQLELEFSFQDRKGCYRGHQISITRNYENVHVLMIRLLMWKTKMPKGWSVYVGVCVFCEFL